MVLISAVAKSKFKQYPFICLVDTYLFYSSPFQSNNIFIVSHDWTFLVA